MSKETKVLYRFYWDYGRMGEVDGVFFEYPSKVQEAIGNTIYFGEILGKHSEVYGELSTGDLEVILDEPVLVEKLNSILGDNIAGYNPINYYEDQKD